MPPQYSGTRSETRLFCSAPAVAPLIISKQGTCAGLVKFAVFLSVVHWERFCVVNCSQVPVPEVLLANASFISYILLNETWRNFKSSFLTGKQIPKNRRYVHSFAKSAGARPFPFATKQSFSLTEVLPHFYIVAAPGVFRVDVVFWDLSSVLAFLLLSGVFSERVLTYFELCSERIFFPGVVQVSWATSQYCWAWVNLLARDFLM